MRTGPPAAWRTAVRTAAFGWVELLAARSHAVLGRPDRLERVTARPRRWLPYWAEYDGIGIDADARSAAHFSLAEEPGRWVITQQLVDPAGDGEWRFVAVVDLATARGRGCTHPPPRALGRLST